MAASVSDDAIGTASVHSGSTVANSGSASSPMTARVQMKCRVAAEARDIRATTATAAIMRIEPLSRMPARSAVITCLRVRGPV